MVMGKINKLEKEVKNVLLITENYGFSLPNKRAFSFSSRNITLFYLTFYNHINVGFTTVCSKRKFKVLETNIKPKSPFLF